MPLQLKGPIRTIRLDKGCQILPHPSLSGINCTMYVLWGLGGKILSQDEWLEGWGTLPLI